MQAGPSSLGPILTGMTPVEPAHEWKYEMRRQAQEILPNLFVGPYQSSNNLDLMQAMGLTHVLCLQDAREAYFVKPRFPEHFVYEVVQIRDAQDQNLIRLFPAAKHFIDSALSAGGRVLVHCGDGISRSPAIVTAYVMCALNIPHEDAFNYVQARRFCVSPNPGFHHQIEAYQHIWEAMQQSATDPNLNQRTASGRRKRGDDDDDDEHEAEADVVLGQEDEDQDMLSGSSNLGGGGGAPLEGQRGRAIGRIARPRLAP